MAPALCCGSDLAMLALHIPVRRAVEMLAAGTRSWHASWPLHGCRGGPRSKSPVRSARSSATKAEELPLGGSRRYGRCTLVGGRGLAVPAQPPKPTGSRGVERMVVVQVQLVHQGQRSSGALHLADGDGTVEGHDRRGRDRKQLVVEGDDLRPVGLLDCCGVRVHCVYGGLDLIRTGLVAVKAPADDRLTLLDQGPIPSSAVLLAEHHQGAVGPHSRRATGLGQE